MDYLERIGPDRYDPTAMPVVALVHNEANILPDFLAHYRGLGRMSFLLVDDRSTDGSAEILAQAPDVTLFRPREGSDYRTDRVRWRSLLLDTHAAGRWCLVPDVDEHFVFVGAPDLAGYIAALEAEGAEAVATLMIDMYADRPLADHLYDGGGLAAAFPLFDGPAPYPDGYAMRPVSRITARRLKTPPIMFAGGARHRLFYPHPWAGTGPVGWLVEREMGMGRPVNAPHGWLARKLSKRLFRGALDCTKLGLLRWRRGLEFGGGPHRVTESLPVSESIAAFLHYAFTRGRAGIEYIAQRGQHADGGSHYKRLLESAALEASPVHPGTRRFEGPGSLAGLIRGVPGR